MTGMERRASLRQPTHQEASLRLPSGAQWPCVIEDYCVSGMYLRFAAEVAVAIKADLQRAGQHIGLSFVDQRSARRFDIVATPARMMRGAMGVQFVQPYPDVMKTLAETGRFELHGATSPKEVEGIIRECTEAIAQHVLPLVEDMFPVLTQALRDAAIKASTDQTANALMAAADRFGGAQGSIIEVVSTGIHDPMRHLNQELDEADMSDRLALIDKNTFEDWLTTRVLITKAETHYRAQLLPLKLRLEAIGLADKQHNQSPFGPALPVNAFQGAVRNHLFDSQSEKVVFKCFNDQVMGKLEALYKQLNGILIAHKILPDLDVTKVIKRSRSVERPKAQTPKPDAEAQNAGSVDPSIDGALEPFRISQPYGGYASAAPGQQMTGSPSAGAALTGAQFAGVHTPDIHTAVAHATAAQAAGIPTGNSQPAGAAAPVAIMSLGRAALDPPFSSPAASMASGATSGAVDDSQIPTLYPEVSGLVQSLRDMNRAEVQASNVDSGAMMAHVHFSEDELVRGLAALQTFDLQPPTERRQSLFERVAEQLQQGDADKQIHEDQKVTIDVVDRFFASLKHNPRLTPETKEHLCRLEIPVLKVVLRDDNFFDDRSSSVRGVMNRIAQLGMKGIRLSPMMQQRLDGLVRRIIEEFEHDTDVFDQVLNELDALIDKQNELYKKNVERVAAAAEGVHKVELARRTVAQALNERLRGRTVPKAVVTLIDSGWKDLLNLTYVKYGMDSDEWYEQLQVIDDLIGLGEDSERDIDLQSLLPIIYQGLKQVSGDAEPPAHVREELKALFKLAPENKHAMQAAKSYDVPQTEDDLARRNQARTQELKPWILRARSFQPGAWMQFNREMEETQYIRLVWVADGFSKFVFVNHQGRKVIELGLFKLAEYLSNGTIMPDPDYETPIFNQSLDDMVRDVYDKLAFEASHDKLSGWPLRQLFCRQMAQRAVQGPKSASSVLVYFRFEPMNQHKDSHFKEIAPSRPFIEKLVAVVEALEFEDKIVGRLDKCDFALFIVSHTPERVAAVVGERLMEFCQHYQDRTMPWLVAWGENRTHLGFVNSETMLRMASRPLLLQSQRDRVAPEPQAEEVIMKPVVETNHPASPPSEPALAADAVPEPVQTLQAQDLSSAPELPAAIDVYVQRAMALTGNSVIEPQYELIASVAGSGLSYEPVNQQQARSLDCWWIELLLARDNYPEADWQGLESVRVKLSGHSLNDEQFTEWLLAEDTLERLGDLQIWFDVYSCDVIENVHAAADRMHQLKAKGFRFCLDHFGSEQSPFPLLKVMPFDMIKMEEAFIRDLNQEGANGTPADSVIEVAHYLRKVVLASSVDSAICLQRMRQYKVDFVQGTTIADYEKLLSWSVLDQVTL